MTLSGRVAPQESPRLRAAIDSLFTEVLLRPVPVDALTLFVETEPGAPFMAETQQETHARQHRAEQAGIPRVNAGTVPGQEKDDWTA